MNKNLNAGITMLLVGVGKFMQDARLMVSEKLVELVGLVLWCVVGMHHVSGFVDPKEVSESTSYFLFRFVFGWVTSSEFGHAVLDGEHDFVTASGLLMFTENFGVACKALQWFLSLVGVIIGVVSAAAFAHRFGKLADGAVRVFWSVRKVVREWYA